MKYILSTETTCELPKEYLATNDIRHCSLSGIIDSEEFGGDLSEMDPKEFFDRMRGGAMTSTTQMNPERAKEHFQKILAEGKDVLHLSFSSGLSGTCNSFVHAAKELNETSQNKIFVVDTRAASLGQGLLVHMVAEQCKDMTAEEAAEFALSIRDDICHYFVVDDLQYLHRGGRVSKTSAIIGKMLSIKPVLHVDLDGKLIPLKKVMTRKKSLSALVGYMVEKFSGKEKSVFISHGDCLSEAEAVATMITERLPVKREDIMINQLGTIIGAHSGPGTIALFFHGTNKKEK